MLRLIHAQVKVSIHAQVKVSIHAQVKSPYMLRLRVHTCSG